MSTGPSGPTTIERFVERELHGLRGSEPTVEAITGSPEQPLVDLKPSRAWLKPAVSGLIFLAGVLVGYVGRGPDDVRNARASNDITAPALLRIDYELRVP